MGRLPPRGERVTSTAACSCCKHSPSTRQLGDRQRELSASLAGASDPVSGSNPVVRRPSGAVAGEISHLRKQPLPAAPTNSPPSATASPRRSVVTGHPLIVLPS